MGGFAVADVVSLGIMVADAVAKPITQLPEKGKLSLVENMELHTGGNAVNTGIALAKLGIDTKIIGKVGMDGFGDFLISQMNKHGADTSAIVRTDKVNTSATMVMVSPDGERSFLHYLGANAELVEEDIDFEEIRGCKILHIGGFYLLPKFDGEPTARLLKRAKEEGIMTSLDPCWDSKGNWFRLIEPCLPYIDVFLPSIEEAKMIAGKEEPSEIAEFFLDYGIKIVGLKMGSQGCYLRTADKEYRIPVYKVKAVDSTGAGDSFVGGFLAGLVKGWDIEKTGYLASAVGAQCVTGIGASTGIGDWEATMEFMRKTPLAK